jgi:hypothetical protein
MASVVVLMAGDTAGGDEVEVVLRGDVEPSHIYWAI